MLQPIVDYLVQWMLMAAIVGLLGAMDYNGCHCGLFGAMDSHGCRCGLFGAMDSHGCTDAKSSNVFGLGTPIRVLFAYHILYLFDVSHWIPGCTTYWLLDVNGIFMRLKFEPYN
ncbi:MAG TPA: hypothetical protein VGO47_06065 [Chlamydiales bacterium]|nr:hypothetical protein [Chlamydiales bacterium]